MLTAKLSPRDLRACMSAAQRAETIDRAIARLLETPAPQYLDASVCAAFGVPRDAISPADAARILRRAFLDELLDRRTAIVAAYGHLIAFPDAPDLEADPKPEEALEAPAEIATAPREARA